MELVFNSSFVYEVLDERVRKRGWRPVVEIADCGSIIYFFVEVV